MNISPFSLRVRFRVWILLTFTYRVKIGQKAKKKKNSEYDKRKLVDLCKITNDKSYEIRDEQDGGGGFYICTSPRAMWLQDRDWTERYKHACVISNNILLD